MTKFKVGDKVEFVTEPISRLYTKGKIYEVVGVLEGRKYRLTDNEDRDHIWDDIDLMYKNFRLVDAKPTKNQRITTLENEVAELKLIVHELRERPQLTTVVNNAPQEPSTTNTVEDIIEFEGAKYRKVDREAREGDVVMQDVEHSAWMEKGHFYRVLSEGKVFLGKGVETLLYTGWNGRTVDTVNVYELIESKPLTPNQQRAEIIEKAKKFVEEHSISKTDAKTNKYVCIKSWKTYIEFVVNTEKRTIVALAKGLATHHVVTRGIAKCVPSDVFNEHIGKAIALGRALGLDVSEFEQAVQPTLAVGQIVFETEDDGYREIAGKGIYTKESMKSAIDSPSAERSKIINDTNAIYGGVE